MRGELRIYLGAAAGVGKTFAMLTEGHHRLSRGSDVVIGYVESHERPNTLSLLEGLEVVPSILLTYRGQMVGEMDTEAILNREPSVVLVDELAHTNSAQCERKKRWQDVNVLLEAGITVISTLNIQHLESLNDVVASITGVTQAETVPDEFVRRANQIELVDMTPEALRRRIVHGNVYPAERINSALENFFRVENLIALRELALLWLAGRVEENLKDFRERHNISSPWETKERIIVALGGAPDNENLIRRAARMAMRANGELIGIHVRAGDGLYRGQVSDLSRYRTLVGEFGGRFYEVTADSVVVGILQVARAENATQIVLGAPQRSSAQRLRGGSIVEEVVNASGMGLDVHIISVKGHVGRRNPNPKINWSVGAISKRRLLIALTVLVFGLPTITLFLSQFRSQLDLSTVSLLYLLFAVLVGLIGGIVPSIVAGVASFGLLNFYFAPPIHTFTISDTRDLVTLITFFAVSLVIGFLIDQMAQKLTQSQKNEARSRLFSQSAEIMLTSKDPLYDLVVLLRESLMRRYVELAQIEGTDQNSRKILASDGGLTEEDRVLTREVEISLPDVVLYVSGGPLSGDQVETIALMKPQIRAALSARALDEERQASQQIKQGDQLRRALLAAISHDLRTPLATIRAASSGLLDEDVELDRESKVELLQTIDQEARTLTEIVNNLLDLSRLNAGALAIKISNVSLAEVVGQALISIRKEIERVELDVPEDLPLILADSALLERAFANLVENALLYSPKLAKIKVTAQVSGNCVILRIIDHGPGILPQDRASVFVPFHRLGDSGSRSGVGLGLAVAKGFVEAQGGSIEIEDSHGGGTTMAVRLTRGP